MKIDEVLAHTTADDAHFQQMLNSLWARQSSPEWQQTWPLLTITNLGAVTVVGSKWPPGLRSIYFFLAKPSASHSVPLPPNTGTPIGFANLHKGGRNGDYQNDPRFGVTMIWISPEFRNQGIAKAFYDFLQNSGIALIPDPMQSAGGAALWKGRTPAGQVDGGGTGLSNSRSESAPASDAYPLAENIAADGDQFFSGPQVEDAWREARNPQSRYTVAYMRPADFMAVAEPGFDPDKWQNVQGYLQRKEPFPTLPFIGFDEAGRVLSHEGRHRMKAMHQLGVQQVPVVLRSSVHRWGETANARSLERSSSAGSAGPATRPTHLHPQTRGHGQPIALPQSAVFP